MRVLIEIGVKSISSTVIAIRGERLVLSRVQRLGPRSAT